MTSRIHLTGLQSVEYAHPLDTEALKQLNAVPGLPSIVRKANDVGLDRIARLESLANWIRITEKQFGELYSLFAEAKAILDIRFPVDLYIAQSPWPNASTRGVEYPHVMLTTALVKSLTDEELIFIIGHELGHVKSEHVLYRQIGSYFPKIAGLIGSASLGIGSLLVTGVTAALYEWIRKSELTADRAGLLVCQNPAVAQRALCRLAGIPDSAAAAFDMNELQAQVDEFNRLAADTSGKALQFLAQMWNEHPWIAIRLSELKKWDESGGYRVLLERHGGRSIQPIRRCRSCASDFPAGSSYCIYCGAYQEMKKPDRV